MNRYETIIEDASALTLHGEDERKVNYVTEQYLLGTRSEDDIKMLAESIQPILRAA